MKKVMKISQSNSQTNKKHDHAHIYNYVVVIKNNFFANKATKFKTEMCNSNWYFNKRDFTNQKIKTWPGLDRQLGKKHLQLNPFLLDLCFLFLHSLKFQCLFVLCWATLLAL